MADVPPFSASPIGGVGAQFFDNNGQVLVGGMLFAYQSGSAIPKNTYTDRTGVTPNPNPIVLNAGGRVPSGEVWLNTDQPYKFVLTDALGNLIGTYDNVTATRGITGDEGPEGPEGPQGQSGGTPTPTPTPTPSGFDPFQGYASFYLTAATNVAANTWTIIPLTTNFIEGPSFKSGIMARTADGKGIKLTSNTASGETIEWAVDLVVSGTYNSNAFQMRLRVGPNPGTAATSVGGIPASTGCVDGCASLSTGPNFANSYDTTTAGYGIYVEVKSVDAITVSAGTVIVRAMQFDSNIA